MQRFGVRPFVLSVPSSYSPWLTRGSCDAASVHFGPTIRRTGILPYCLLVSSVIQDAFCLNFVNSWLSFFSGLAFSVTATLVSHSRPCLVHLCMQYLFRLFQAWYFVCWSFFLVFHFTVPHYQSMASVRSARSPYVQLQGLSSTITNLHFFLYNLVLYLLVSFTSPFPFFLTSSIFCFSIPSHFTRMAPLRFQAGCRRRRLNIALVFVCTDFMLYLFSVKDACLFL